ncbi:MAG TPA: LysE family translocator [Pyrinomonadaceae bacterium]|nr:LysE family translocator [Pyrinomonadaceae bacterium]
MSTKLLLLFALTEFLMSLTPGPAVLLIISQGMHVGFRSSLKGILGILTGNVLYFSLSAVGLGALLQASTTLFQIIRWLGIAYLVLMGAKMLLIKRPSREFDNRQAEMRLSLQLFSQGVVTQLSNPKAIIFFTALLPQFVSPVARPGGMLLQFLVLGIVSLIVEFPVLMFYGWLGERGGSLVPARFSALPDRVAGGFLIGAGLGLASIHAS